MDGLWGGIMIDAFAKKLSGHSVLGQVRFSPFMAGGRLIHNYALGHFTLADRAVVCFGEQRNKGKCGTAVSATYYLHRAGDAANYFGFTLDNEENNCGTCLEVFCCLRGEGGAYHVFDGSRGAEMAMGAKNRILDRFLSRVSHVSNAQDFDGLLSNMKDLIKEECEIHERRLATFRVVGGDKPTCG